MIDDCHLSGWSESGEVLMKSQKSLALIGSPRRVM